VPGVELLQLSDAAEARYYISARGSGFDGDGNSFQDAVGNRYSVYLLYQHKSTNTDAEIATPFKAPL